MIYNYASAWYNSTMKQFVRRVRGFTLIELIVVIAIIGILATISIVGFGRYQADTRDARQASSTSVLAEALEKYYDKNGEYPSCAAMTQPPATVISTTLPGLDPNALTAPRAPFGTNSITCNSLSNTSSDNVIAYVGDGSTACATGSACLQYTLQYVQESTGTVVSSASRRQVSLATSIPITDLNVTNIDFGRIDLAWSAVSGAGNYNIQTSTSSTFGTNTPSTSTSNNASVTGLSPGTLYYFRVQAFNASSTGSWSNTVSATTNVLATPTGTAVADPGSPTSQLKFSWNSVSGATSYTAMYSGSSDMSFPTTLPSSTSPITVTGLTTGSTRYFQVQALASGYSSSWSTTVSATTAPPAPTGVAATTNSPTQVTVNWNTVPNATSYTVEYSTSASFSPLLNVSGIVSNSAAISGLNQNQVYYFRVYALIGSLSSAASSSVNSLTTIGGPAAYSITAYDNSGVWTATSQAICAANTTPNYYWYANGSAWVNGDQYQTVGYSLSYGQGITLTVNTRCHNSGDTVTSGWVGASNSAGYTRPTPAPYLNGLSVGGSRRVTTSWSGVCGGLNELLLRQGSYTDTSSARFAQPNNYGTTDSRSWYSGGLVRYNVRTTCNGYTSAWSNEQDANV